MWRRRTDAVGCISASNGCSHHFCWPPKNDEFAEEEGDHQSFAKHETFLIMLVSFSKAQEEEKQGDEHDGVVTEHDDAREECQMHNNNPAWDIDTC